MSATYTSEPLGIDARSRCVLGNGVSVGETDVDAGGMGVDVGETEVGVGGIAVGVEGAVHPGRKKTIKPKAIS